MGEQAASIPVIPLGVKVYYEHQLIVKWSCTTLKVRKVLFIQWNQNRGSSVFQAYDESTFDEPCFFQFKRNKKTSKFCTYF
jgi:hypothetical protein